MNEDDKEDMIVEYLARMCWITIVGLIVAVLIAMCSCTRTVYVPQASIQRDSIYLTQYKRDSIYLHDSVYVRMKADTLIVEKWHTKYIEKLSTDTLYIEKNDTIREPYPVQQPLSTMQKAWINVGKLATGLSFTTLIALFIYFYVRRDR